ncbi:uncharacterized protein LOC123523995 isoform X2 [Mercenaria mercenaria]|nr:uncharacterized protein LOC123523995 isoform X2 [Mercenaria mercenaria]XP_053395321.1 uncharacterized protein LOC123523995 isoform X2 [Mercenaria mercenaria]
MNLPFSREQECAYLTPVYSNEYTTDYFYEDINLLSHKTPEKEKTVTDFFPRQSFNKMKSKDQENVYKQYDPADSCISVYNSHLLYSKEEKETAPVNDLHMVPSMSKASYELLPRMHGPSCNPIKIALNVPVNYKIYHSFEVSSEKTVSKNVLTIQFVEECYSHSPETIVAVKPLKAADDILKPNDQSKQIIKNHELDKLHEEGNKNGSLDIEHIQKSLDWDKTIRFLVQRIPPHEWKLFFNCLFGYAKHLIPYWMSIDNKISQIETDVKCRSGGVSTLMFELFKYWKEVMGTEINTDYIFRALADMSYNSIAGEFREFLRYPPCNPVCSELSEELRLATTYPTGHRMTGYGQRRLDVFALHNKTETLKMSDKSSGLQVSRRELNEVALQIATNNISHNVPNFPEFPGTSGCNTFGEHTHNKSKKRTLNTNEMSDSDTEYVSCKRPKLSNIEPNPNERIVLKNTRKSLIQWNKVDKESLIIDMIKRLLGIDQQLNYVQYDIFVKYVLTLIIEKTNTSETVILSIQYFDYEHVLEIKGRYKHVSYILDTKVPCYTSTTKNGNVLNYTQKMLEE